MSSDALSALADPTRRAILERIAAAPCAVGDLAAGVDVTPSAVSQHLKLLREAGLAVEERRGRQRWYRISAQGVEQAMRYLEGLRPRPADSASAATDNLDRQAARLPVDDWPDLDPDLIRVSFRIRMIARLMEQTLDQTALHLGMRGGELLVLDALRRQGPPYESTPTQLKDATWITLAGLGKRLDRLEAGGRVERRADPQDGRGSIVRLTAKGRRNLERALRIGRGSPDFLALAELPALERQGLAALLRRLQGRMEELLGSAP